MSEPWTPGPWYGHSVGRNGRAVIRAGDGWYDADDVSLGREAQANARLIIAAPEMARWIMAVLTAGDVELPSKAETDGRALMARIQGDG